MKTVFQKAVSLILSLAVLLGTTPLVRMTASAAESGDVTAYYCDSGLFKDSHYTETVDDAFRSTITGVQVGDDTQIIGDSAFESCKALTAIAIPGSVTTIGNRAFYQCAKLKSVTFGKNSPLNLIGEYAFFQCTALTAIVIPDGVTAIGNEAFQLCGIKSVTFGEGSKLKSIGESAFECCGDLTQIRIPDSVTTIGNHALQQCTNLKSVTFGEGSKLQSIGEFAFLSDENLTDFEIPQSVTKIGREAFFFCSSLTRIEIPHGVTALGADFDDQTFGACTGLTCVTVSDSLPVHADTFNGCTSLSNLYVIGSQKPSAMREVTNVFFFSENPDGTYKLEDYSGTGAGRVIPAELYGKDINPPIQEADLHEQEIIAYCDGANIYKNQDKTGAIGSGDPYRFMISKVEFTGADIQTITAPGSYEGAFLNCTGLTEITVPASVTQIGSNSFRDCTGLKSLAFENGSKLQSIGSQAFDGCVKLNGIDLPGGVTFIGPFAFNGCKSLTGIDLPGGVTDIPSNTFNNCTGLTDIVIPDNVTKIEYMAFAGCTSLKNVTFGKDSKLQSIGIYAFRGCTSLTGISIPKSVTEIASSAFSGCTGLTDITIPKSVTNFGYGVFSRCGSLNKIAVEPGNTVLYTDDSGVLFYIDPTAGKTLVRCPVGKSGTYEIPNGIVRMDESSFFGCTGLTGVTIPDSIQFISPYAFDGCTGLNFVKFGGSATINDWYSNYAFH
ncbi:MAG TPA: leucine-rich repeat domain-containing protein, partial [Clostridia bacterium]|nr:leucine-rich repeat domain-containing protein [Clostridia bacterium]